MSFGVVKGTCTRENYSDTRFAARISARSLSSGRRRRPSHACHCACPEARSSSVLPGAFCRGRRQETIRRRPSPILQGAALVPRHSAFDECNARKTVVIVAVSSRTPPTRHAFKRDEAPDGSPGPQRRGRLGWVAFPLGRARAGNPGPRRGRRSKRCCEAARCFSLRRSLLATSYRLLTFLCSVNSSKLKKSNLVNSS